MIWPNRNGEIYNVFFQDSHMQISTESPAIAAVAALQSQSSLRPSSPSMLSKVVKQGCICHPTSDSQSQWYHALLSVAQ